jgi:flagellar hook-length control protein FliK
VLSEAGVTSALKRELPKDRAAAPAAADKATPQETSPASGDVPQQALEAPASQSRESDAAQKGAAPAVHAQRTTAAAPVAVDVSSEDPGSSRENASRQTSRGAIREYLIAGRPTEIAQGSQGGPVFATAIAAPAAAQASVQAAAPAPVPVTPQQEADNVARLVESMRVQFRQGVPEATVRLRPEHLGEVTIAIRVDRGVVSAVVHAETPAVQQWLESQEDKLRNGLADQGLSLEKFVVREREQERREQRPQHQPPPRYRQPRGEGRENGQGFEVTA